MSLAGGSMWKSTLPNPKEKKKLKKKSYKDYKAAKENKKREMIVNVIDKQGHVL